MTKVNKILLFIFLSIITLGCALVIQPKYHFIVKNESSYDINIRFYHKSIILDSLNIKSKNQFEKVISSGYGGVISPFEGKTDSLIIQFGNDRYIKQYCGGLSFFPPSNCLSPKNLLDFATGEFSSKIVNRTFYTITYDNTDYETAMPL